MFSIYWIWFDKPFIHIPYHIYVSFGVTSIQFYINFSRQGHQIELILVAINSLEFFNSSLCPLSFYLNRLFKRLTHFIIIIFLLFIKLLILNIAFWALFNCECTTSARTAAIYYFITGLFMLLACFDTYFALPLNVSRNL